MSRSLSRLVYAQICRSPADGRLRWSRLRGWALWLLPAWQQGTGVAVGAAPQAVRTAPAKTAPACFKNARREVPLGLHCFLLLEMERMATEYAGLDMDTVLSLYSSVPCSNALVKAHSDRKPSAIRLGA